MAGGCGVGAFCSFCGKCGRVFTSVVPGVEVPQVAPPGVAMVQETEKDGKGEGLPAEPGKGLSGELPASEGSEERPGAGSVERGA